MEVDTNSIHYSLNGDRKQDEILLQPFNYILQIPGKNIRTKLTHAFNYWLNIPDNKLQVVANITQMLHNSSLLLDDIQDNSILRRGIPVAHSIFGVPSTINAANYVSFISLEKIIALKDPEATQIFSEQILELYRGQGMEINWRDNYTCPTEEEYTHMTIKKTGGLFNMAVRLMQLYSTCNKNFSQLVRIISLYFQIRDDYCNLCSQEYKENKSYCEDLSEGKFSFPIIHAIKHYPEDNQIMNILRQRTKNFEVKRYCVNLLEKYGSFAYTRNALETLDKKARDEIEQLGGNPLLIKILDEIKDWRPQET